ANWMIDHTVAASFPTGQPAWLASGTGGTVRVQFARGMKYLGSPAASAPTVWYRVGRSGPFTSAALSVEGTDEGGPVFTHALPAGACGAVTQWYYSTTLPDMSVATAPQGGAGAPYEATAKLGMTVFADDFETDLGWTVGDTVSP